MQRGKGSERVRLAGNHYIVNWDHDARPGETYRIRVFVGEGLVGLADLSGNSPLLKGGRLPIKFRIEQGALGAIAPVLTGLRQETIPGGCSDPFDVEYVFQVDYVDLNGLGEGSKLHLIWTRPDGSGSGGWEIDVASEEPTGTLWAFSCDIVIAETVYSFYLEDESGRRSNQVSTEDAPATLQVARSSARLAGKNAKELPAPRRGNGGGR